MDVKIDELIDTDDVGFVSDFARKYKVISELASLDKLVQYYDPSKYSGDPGFLYDELKARISLFRQLKEYYDDRIELMTSPYYALFGKDELGEFLGKDGEKKDREIMENAVRRFIILYRKVYSSPLMSGKKKDVIKRFNSYINEKKNELAKNAADKRA